MTTDKQEVIKEFSELINVPQFERIIIHKINELKELFSEEIELYRNIKDNFSENSSAAPLDNKAPAAALPPVNGGDPVRFISQYSFQLDRDPGGEWLPACIDPPPPISPGEIVPPEIIKYIATFEPNPGKIEIRKNFTLPSLDGRYFDLNFTRYSHHHALGMIAEHKIIPFTPRRTNNTAPAPCETNAVVNNIININDTNSKSPEKGDFRSLIYYMEQFPALKKHIFTEFFMKWKPLIDNRLIESKAERSSG